MQTAFQIPGTKASQHFSGAPEQADSGFYDLHERVTLCMYARIFRFTFGTLIGSWPLFTFS